MPELMLTLPFPPSVNSYWRNIKGRTLISEKGESLEQMRLQQSMNN